MFAFLEALFSHYGYAAVFFVLVICGFGVPIPEDLTLVTGGVISGLGHTNSHWMIVVGIHCLFFSFFFFFPKIWKT